MIENLGIAESLALEIQHQDEKDRRKAKEIMSKLDREVIGAEAIKVESLFARGMKDRGYTELQKAQARRLWRDFLRTRGSVRLTARRHGPPPWSTRSPGRTTSTISNRRTLPSLRRLARSVSLRFREIVQILKLGEGAPLFNPLPRRLCGGRSGPSWEEEWEYGDDPWGRRGCHEPLDGAMVYPSRESRPRSGRGGSPGLQHGAGHYWRAQIDNAVALWHEYCSHASKNGTLRIYKSEVWAAAVEYAIARIDGEPVSQPELAEINMVSVGAWRAGSRRSGPLSS